MLLITFIWLYVIILKMLFDKLHSFHFEIAHLFSHKLKRTLLLKMNNSPCILSERCLIWANWNWKSHLRLTVMTPGLKWEDRRSNPFYSVVSGSFFLLYEPTCPCKTQFWITEFASFPETFDVLSNVSIPMLCPMSSITPLSPSHTTKETVISHHKDSDNL